MSFDKINPRKKHNDGPSEIPKEKLEGFINLGYSQATIAKNLRRSQGSVYYWLKKHNLKTKHQYRKGGHTYRENHNIATIDWEIIQRYYNDNHSWRDVRNEFHISQHTIVKAIKLQLINPRSWQETYNLKRINYKHTDESKRKLSIARKEFLSKNPNQPSWKQNNKKYSIPCEKLKQKLLELNIKFTEEFQPLIHIKRFFSIDIAFPEQKIGLEINGRQHYDSNGNLLPYYQNRHDLILKEGWILYEIPYHKAFNTDFILYILNKHNLVAGVGHSPTTHGSPPITSL